MAQKWYKKTAVQAAIISGVFLMIATIVGKMLNTITKETHRPTEEAVQTSRKTSEPETTNGNTPGTQVDKKEGGQKQTGRSTIEGVVVDQEGNVLAGVSVVLEPTSLGTSTDFEGRFIIKNVPSGTYTIVIRYMGYASKSFRSFQVRANEHYDLGTLSM